MTEVDRQLASAQLVTRFVTDAYIDNKRYLLYDEVSLLAEASWELIYF